MRTLRTMSCAMILMLLSPQAFTQTLTTDKSEYAYGEAITFQWSGRTENPKDCLIVWSSQGSIGRMYSDSTKVGNRGVTDGELTFAEEFVRNLAEDLRFTPADTNLALNYYYPLPAGTWYVYWDNDIGLERKTAVKFTVVGGENKVKVAPLLDEPTTTPSETITNSIGMKLTKIQPGIFMMGSDKWYAGLDERPVHKVTITQPFYIGTHEVTQAQYAKIMRKNTSSEELGSDIGVETVSWDEAKEFCRKLSKKENVEYRLPTEAEWEYCCRAGTQTDYFWGNADIPFILRGGFYSWTVENYTENESFYIKRPNPWGLYDMSGYLWEWCEDWYQRSYGDNTPKIDPKGPSNGLFRVYRGGGWDLPIECRSSNRPWDNAGSGNYNIGFRVVREIDE